MAVSNPITLCHNALWSAVEGHAAFATLIKKGNRVKYNTGAKAKPAKDAVSSADLPELRLYWEAVVGATLHADSCYDHYPLRFLWQLSSGSHRQSRDLEPVVWMLLESMSAAYDTELYNLKWAGATFVHEFNIIDGVNGVSEVDLNRGISGWSNLLRYEIKTNISLASMVSAYQGDG